MTPGRIVAFLIVVLCLLGVLGFVLPTNGLKIGEQFTLRFPSPAELMLKAKPEEVDISSILGLEEDTTDVLSMDLITLDSLNAAMANADTITPDLLTNEMNERSAFQYPNNDRTLLYPLFAELELAKNQKKPLRVLHYGDSQLEGDRITSYIRNKFQGQFSGTGPGLVCIADIVPSFSVERTLQGNWIRYSVMDKRDKNQKHGRFGALSTYSRFTPILPDSTARDTVIHTASITLTPHERAYGKARSFSSCKLYYGWHSAPVRIDLRQGDELISTQVVPAAQELLIREWKFTTTPEALTITFTGTDSPDIYGISLEGSNGVIVDNIAARGASGYEFHAVDQGLLRSMYADLNVALIILQYGGNVLPNIKSVEEAKSYGHFFGAQIARFRKLIPGVSVIVIGPSDMSIKEGEDYVTRPFLEDVRDAMQANALEQGAVFWDMYEAMGGRNSMVSWVNAEPPLAAKDYTHFSPKGSRKIGELFFHALTNDLSAFRVQPTKKDTLNVP